MQHRIEDLFSVSIVSTGDALNCSCPPQSVKAIEVTKWGKKKRKNCKTHQLLESNWEERDINLRSDLTSWCFFLSSPVQEWRPHDEDVLPHHYGTIRHKLTTFGDHRCKALSVWCNRATVPSVWKGVFGGGYTCKGCMLVCLPYIFGFPFAATDMSSSLHIAEPPHHSSSNLFNCTDGLTAIRLFV